LQGSIFPEIDLLGLDGLEKALSGSVVVRIALVGHADQEAVLEERLHIVVRGILDASIRVMNGSLGGTAICNGHLEGLQAQSGVDIARDGIRLYEDKNQEIPYRIHLITIISSSWG